MSFNMPSHMPAVIQSVESSINYHFNDSGILWEALQAAGSGSTYIDTRQFAEGNKKLAFLGDAVLKLALLEGWYSGGGIRGMERPPSRNIVR